MTRPDRFSAIASHPALAVHVFAPDGTTRLVNAAYTELFGLTAADWATSGTIWAIPRFADSDLSPYLRRAWSGEHVTVPPRAYSRAEIPQLPRERLWVKTLIVPVCDENGELAEIIAIHEDVTEAEEMGRTLSERQAQYRSIFEATSDGLIVNDLTTGVVVAANPAACAMYGAAEATFVGLRPEAYVHREDLWVLTELAQAVLRGEHHSATVRLLRADGTLRTIEAQSDPVTYEGRPHVLSVVRDVTASVEAYETLERRVEERTTELSLLLRNAQRLGSTLDRETLLRVMLEQLREVVEYKAAAVFWLLNRSEMLLLHYEGPIAQDLLTRRWSLAEAGHSRLVVEQRQPLIIADVMAETPEARAFRTVALKQLGSVPDYIRSWMGVPLLLRDSVIGMIAFDHGTQGFYTEHHAQFALAFAQQAAVAIENARLFEQVNQWAALNERQRLARELHDSVSQALYGIALGTKTARALLTRDPTLADDPLAYVLSLAEAGLTEMRALIFELRPESLENEGLIVALEKHTAALRLRHELAIDAELGSEPEAPFAAKEALYRVAQEALHNIVKHARARQVRVALRGEDGGMRLEIADDGVGFDPGRDYPGHLGLRSMRERVALEGGTLRIDSQPGQGSRLIAIIPPRERRQA